MMDLISNHGFDSRAQRTFFSSSRSRYEIRHTILYTKQSSTVWRMEGWSVLEAAKTPLSTCAIAGCQSRYHAPLLTDTLPFVSCVKTDTLAWSRMPKSSKKSMPSYFQSMLFRQLCTCHLIECTVYLRLSDYWPRTQSSSAGVRGQHLLHTRLVRRAKINDKGNNKVVLSIEFYLP